MSQMNDREIIESLLDRVRKLESITYKNQNNPVRTAPVMPTFDFIEEIFSNDEFAAIVTNNRVKFELYWKALDEFNGVKA